MVEKTNCPYKTPCGWCTKWDKKCDRKILEQQSKPYDYLKEAPTNKTCTSDFNHEWKYNTISIDGYTLICKKCGQSKHEPFVVCLDSVTPPSVIQEIIENVVEEN